TWGGRGAFAAALLTEVVGGAAIAMGLPAMPMWLTWAALKSARHGRWALAASAMDDADAEARLRSLGTGAAIAASAALLVVALAVRVGWPVPVVSAVARPVLAEGERTRQLEVL